MTVSYVPFAMKMLELITQDMPQGPDPREEVPREQAMHQGMAAGAAAVVEDRRVACLMAMAGKEETCVCTICKSMREEEKCQEETQEAISRSQEEERWIQDQSRCYQAKLLKAKSESLKDIDAVQDYLSSPNYYQALQKMKDSLPPLQRGNSTTPSVPTQAALEQAEEEEDAPQSEDEEAPRELQEPLQEGMRKKTETSEAQERYRQRKEEQGSDSIEAASTVLTKEIAAIDRQ